MNGNAAEWCSDSYASSYLYVVADPVKAVDRAVRLATRPTSFEEVVLGRQQQSAERQKRNSSVLPAAIVGFTWLWNKVGQLMRERISRLKSAFRSLRGVGTCSCEPRVE